MPVFKAKGKEASAKLVSKNLRVTVNVEVLLPHTSVTFRFIGT